jgi:hypothetical protein
MPLANQQLVVGDFSGGITDYILDAQPNQSSVIENLVINKNRKLETVPGSDIYNALYPQIPDGAVRITGLFKSLDPQLYVTSSRKVWYPGVSAWTELVGPTSNPAFSVGNTSTFVSTSEWNGHIYAVNSDYATPIKIFKGASAPQVRTAGLPDLATAPVCTPPSGGSSNSYIYAFAYEYTYTVNNETTFQDIGPVTYVSISTNNNISGSHVVAITAIPTLSNGTTLNYETTVVRVFIYRTISGGTTFYKVGQVTNGTATFNDSTTDATLINNDLLYTNGDVLNNDPPPQCKYVHVVNGVAYYANIKSGTEFYKNQIRQSIPGDPDSCPEDLTIDLLEEIVGISSYNDNPIVFSKKRVYRLNGQYDDLGQGQVIYEDITKTVGCMSHNSIVQTRYGVFWAGDDGFYWTDGFQFKKISDSFNDRYQDLVSSDTRRSRIYGAYDTVDNKIHWACTSADSSTDNDCFFTLDLRWGISEASTFTTRVGGSSFAPTAILYYSNDLLRADRRGYLFKHNSSYTTDPKVNTLAAYSTWPVQAIVPNYISTVFNFGYPMVRKWVPKILLSMQNETDVSVQINSINDQSTTTNPLLPIRVRENVLWGTTTAIWGSLTPYWSNSQLIEQMRRFPAGSLRCSFKQIQITQAYTNIYNSDTFGTANVNSSTKTATLLGALSWPADSVDYYISFEHDNYTKQYLVTSVSGSNLVYLDPATNQPTDFGSKWLIKGQPKGEVFNILSYIVYYAPLTDQSYKTYRKEQDSTGDNA